MWLTIKTVQLEKDVFLIFSIISLRSFQMYLLWLNIRIRKMFLYASTHLDYSIYPCDLHQISTKIPRNLMRF